ncbi:MAG: WecB/TagA/CpsF family glycosyltransferase [Myxococcota bacterium]|nr:WecB/TagA/CpsF family glycosyltransferase [Myxococcota bacterium]
MTAATHDPEYGATEVVELAGLPIARIGPEEVADHVFRSLDQGRGGWILTANVDFLERVSRQPAIRELFLRADLVVADGTPLLWAARLLGKPLPARVAGSDLVETLAAHAERRGRSLYLLGGEGDAAWVAAERLRARHPDLRIAGVSSPRLSAPPSPDEIAQVRQDLLAARPDIVYVAFGSPKQEQVIEAVRHELPATWMLGCGISLSFLAGHVRRAPVWMQRSGLEWVHRLGSEPGRLASRYLLRDLPYAVRLLWRSARSGS